MNKTSYIILKVLLLKITLKIKIYIILNQNNYTINNIL